jgi:hypothetical protein
MKPSQKNKAFLIHFDFEEYCQGYEWAYTDLLVYAKNFEEACKKVSESGNYYHAKNFKNYTIE